MTGIYLFLKWVLMGVVFGVATAAAIVYYLTDSDPLAVVIAGLVGFIINFAGTAKFIKEYTRAFPRI